MNEGAPLDLFLQQPSKIIKRVFQKSFNINISWSPNYKEIFISILQEIPNYDTSSTHYICFSLSQRCQKSTKMFWRASTNTEIVILFPIYFSF